MQPTFMMSRPEHLAADWNELADALRERGARIEELPARAGEPDLVSTANAGVVLDGIALLDIASPHHGSFFTALYNRGLIRSVHHLPSGVALEGTRDCVWDSTRQCFWLGHGQRSDARVATTLHRVFDVDVVPLELVRPCHLDTALVPLVYGDALVVRRAFSDDGWRVIRGRVGTDNIIQVPDEDAANLATNVVCMGNDILMGRCSEQLEADLAGRGYRVVRLPMESFNKSGGSAFSLTLRLDHTSSRRASARNPVREPFGFAVARAW